MAADLRRLGYNIEKASLSKYASKAEFAQAINLSVADVTRVFEGRLLLSPVKLKELAKLIGTSVRDLLDVTGEYNFVECMGNFKNKENEDKILDMIDNYIDLLEAIS